MNLRLRRLIAVLFAAILTGAAGFAPWMDGTKAEPEMQVQSLDADTYVIRQSIRTNFEGPFLYLFFGADRALLLDTGAGGLDVRPTIDGFIDDWRKRHGKASLPLIVAHTHAHGDHHQGDAAFAARADTTVVGLTPEKVAAFFKITDWPNQIATLDLGKRVLHIIPTPGHEPSHIMVYDERTRLLQSGDAFYPGRLYFRTHRFAEFRASIDRVVAFTKTHPVSVILGNHIEMTRTPGKDYAMEAPNHPDERRLELSVKDLVELQTALHAMGDKPAREVHDSFIVYPR